MPTDISKRAKARLATFYFRDDLSVIIIQKCIFFEKQKSLSQDGAAAIEGVYQMWNDETAINQGEYLIGEYSLADIMFLPSVVRFAAHYQPDERWPYTLRWVQTLLARKWVKVWLDEAYQLEPIYHPGYRD